MVTKRFKNFNKKLDNVIKEVTIARVKKKVRRVKRRSFNEDKAVENQMRNLDCKI